MEELLERMRLAGRADDPVRTLSRGLLQRVAVCRAVLHDPPLLLLDEPRANLDPAAAELIEPLIGRASGRTRVITSHDPAGGLAEADLALGLRDGRGAAARRPTRSTRPRRGAVPVSARRRARCCARTCCSSGRAPESIPAMLLFSVTTFVLFHFGARPRRGRRAARGRRALVTLLFAAILGINRLFVSEQEEGGFDGVLLAPIDRTALFVAKASALFAVPHARRARRGAGVRDPAAGALAVAGAAGADRGAGARRTRRCRSSARSSPRSRSAPARAT